MDVNNSYSMNTSQNYSQQNIHQDVINDYNKHSHTLVWCEIALILLSVLLESCVFIWEIIFPHSSYEALYYINIVVNFFFVFIWLFITAFNLFVYIQAHNYKKKSQYVFWNHVLEGPFKLVLNISLILSGSLLVMATFATNQFLTAGMGSFDPNVFRSFSLFWIISMFLVLSSNIILMILAFHYRKGEYIIN